MVLRSLEELGALPAAALPISRLGTTYAMAQDAAWVDFDNFAVGRWDGTLNVLARTTRSMPPPVMRRAAS